jgi:Xaa-Pro aminopeptidase
MAGGWNGNGLLINEAECCAEEDAVRTADEQGMALDTLDARELYRRASAEFTFGGHGLGRTMHEDPHVPNKGRPGRGLILRPGLTIALEPWFAATTDRIVFDKDGWTIRSADSSRTAHSEHTIAITEDGPFVLTRRDDERPPSNF